MRNVFTRTVLVIVVFYLVCAGLAVGMWKLTNFINNQPYGVGTQDSEGSFEKAVDAYQSVNNMLNTFATGLLAALGFLMINLPKQRGPGQESWWAAISAVFACMSLYWGYVSSQNVVAALEGQTFTLDVPSLQLPRQLQVASMLLGVICVAHFVVRTMIIENSAGGPSNVPSA